ncbi:MAG: hypothetical protein Terrestrivirus19_2 [Terrestrivirus sp.]|uniref:Uncharacterized protein n=1 Tax=Terrestrivirus sp. TaxID=2487775 RepID=A0A3G4ZPG2_9VIRU|nr:MAG: hypothetical protein Terrestrivirus19_2 [Terrestrivirus sp.]
MSFANNLRNISSTVNKQKSDELQANKLAEENARQLDDEQKKISLNIAKPHVEDVIFGIDRIKDLCTDAAEKGQTQMIICSWTPDGGCYKDKCTKISVSGTTSYSEYGGWYCPGITRDIDVNTVLREINVDEILKVLSSKLGAKVFEKVEGISRRTFLYVVDWS